jgi:hypothetical protein
MIIQVTNDLQVNAPKTYLSQGYAAGVGTFILRNTNGLGSSWAIQVGEVGQEQTEVLVLSGNPGAGTLGTTTAVSRFEHPADTPVYGIKFDQVVFERSTTGTSGTATPMTDGTVTYQADHAVTIFDDTAGVGTYAYRTRFRNSVLGSNTSQSDWQTPAGFSFYSLGKMRQRIKDKLWNSGFIKDDATIDDWINEWKDEMSNAVIKVNEDYAMGTVDVAFGTAGYGTITTNDFKNVKQFWVVTSGGTNESTKMRANSYLPGQIFVESNPYHNWVGDTVFQVHPSESGGTARLQFYRFGTTMVNDTDELPLPMRSYTKSFVDYGLAQALFLDGKTNEYDRKLGEANVSKEQFVNEIVPHDQSGPTYIEIREPISGDDYVL